MLDRAQLHEAILYNGTRGYPADESYAMVVALLQELLGLKADGKRGPKTEAAIAARWPEPEPTDEGVMNLDMFFGEAEHYPKNYHDRVRVLGVPGDKDSAWYHAHIVERHHDSAFAGVPGKWYVKVHRVAEKHLEEAFRRAHQCSSYRIGRVGSFNYRHVRFSKKVDAKLSSHAFGIAVDIDPVRNRLVDADDIDGKLPGPFTAAWRELYPDGVDENFVRAFENCGFRWGGRYRSFLDPMHFEWVGNRAYASAFYAR